MGRGCWSCVASLACSMFIGRTVEGKRDPRSTNAASSRTHLPPGLGERDQGARLRVQQVRNLDAEVARLSQGEHSDVVRGGDTRPNQRTVGAAVPVRTAQAQSRGNDHPAPSAHLSPAKRYVPNMLCVEGRGKGSVRVGRCQQRTIKKLLVTSSSSPKPPPQPHLLILY